MVLFLQAYEQVGDAEAVENATVDLRWQLGWAVWARTGRRFRTGRWLRIGSG